MEKLQNLDPNHAKSAVKLFKKTIYLVCTVAQSTNAKYLSDNYLISPQRDESIDEEVCQIFMSPIVGAIMMWNLSLHPMFFSIKAPIVAFVSALK